MINRKAPMQDAITPAEQAHSELVRKRISDCMVLLKNDGVLPLKGLGRVALFGNGARATVKGGTGSGDVNARFTISVEQGLEEAGFTVTTKRWLDEQERLSNAEKRFFLEARAARAKSGELGLALFAPFLPMALAPASEALLDESNTDTAIYVLARNSGEGADRQNVPGDYQLLSAERELLTQLGNYYSHLVVLLNIGGVMDAPAVEAIPGVGAILLMGQSGNQSGYAVADVLTGRTVPSGRLADTWARRYSDYPSAATFSHNNGNTDEEYYTEGVYVGYRYFDSYGITPFYPFGYGLNYTTFCQRVLGVTANEKTVALTVEIENTGRLWPGREVVQVYVSQPAAPDTPYQELAAFAKTRLLAPGEKEVLSVTFLLTDLERYCESRSAYLLPAGTYTLRVGSNSRNTHIAARLRLSETAITRKVASICPPDVAFDELPAPPLRQTDSEIDTNDIPVFQIDSAKIPAETVDYPAVPQPLPCPCTDQKISLDDVADGRNTLADLTAQLSVAEMANLCVGTARDADDSTTGSIIGAASQTVPGAAGETTVLLADRGIRPMVMADGPAGLRLTPHFRTDAAGNVMPGGEIFGDMVVPLSPLLPGQQDYYQYCTAIPTASLLACSWDLALIEEIGNVIGAEMEQFGVQMWLAPGMNIHRNPLCGRNFEYYSEDPLLSGLCAAADVRGVQRHPSVGACMKHFCANNQEENRMFVNEHIHEKALRDIYLRNFSVAIRAGKPKAMMTSYNLINGVHTANSYDLISRFARAECGFSGYVMTDWFTSHAQKSRSFALHAPHYPCSSSPLCVYAGNDIQMPGCEQNILDLCAAVEDGSIPLGMLQQCSLRLLTAVLDCFYRTR